MDTPRVQFVLVMPLTLLDIMPSLVSMGVMLWHDTCDILAKTGHRAHLGVQVEAGNDLMANHSHTYPADLLLTNWATGKTAAFDISVSA